jgi:hypothetical protein
MAPAVFVDLDLDAFRQPWRLISRPWTEEDDRRLSELVQQKRPARSIGLALRRSEKAVNSRLWKLRQEKKEA